MLQGNQSGKEHKNPLEEREEVESVEVVLQVLLIWGRSIVGAALVTVRASLLKAMLAVKGFLIVAQMVFHR